MQPTACQYVPGLAAPVDVNQPHATFGELGGAVAGEGVARLPVVVVGVKHRRDRPIGCATPSPPSRSVIRHLLVYRTTSSCLPYTPRLCTFRRWQLPCGARRSQVERRQESEHALLSAAAEVIAERGINGASLSVIGERAGTSRGLPAHHFGSKDALVARVASAAQDRMAEVLLASIERSRARHRGDARA